MKERPIRFAPLRYKTCHWHGWKWRQGFAIDLPGHPRLRFCVARIAGRWCVDQYDTGFSLAAAGTHTSRRRAAAALLAMVPMLLAGGRYAKLVRKHARQIRRARALGRAR